MRDALPRAQSNTTHRHHHFSTYITVGQHIGKGSEQAENEISDKSLKTPLSEDFLPTVQPHSPVTVLAIATGGS